MKLKLIVIILLTLAFTLPSGSAFALTQTEVSQLYVGIFGRAAEGDGNRYWQSNTSMTVAANIMLSTDPAQAYFGSTLYNNLDFIEHIYLNTLGKTYAEDTPGVDYWVSELDGGKSKGEVIATLISAAQHSANAGAAQDRFNNKVEVSNYCADKISAFTDLDTFTGFISSVADDAASVAAAKVLIDANSGPLLGSLTVTGSNSEIFNEHSFVPESLEYLANGDIQWTGINGEYEWSLIVALVPGSSPAQTYAVTFNNGWTVEQIREPIVDYTDVFTPVSGVTIGDTTITFTNVTGSDRLTLDGTLSLQ